MPVNLSDPFGLCPLCITAGGRWGGIRDLSRQSKSNSSALTESATARRRSTSSVGWLAPLSERLIWIRDIPIASAGAFGVRPLCSAISAEISRDGLPSVCTSLSFVCTVKWGGAMPEEARVRKNLRLSQAKLNRARHLLGTTTETETVEQALDLVAFRHEVIKGVHRMAGSNAVRDVFDDEATV